MTDLKNLAELAAVLDAVNGRRRLRTLTMNELQPEIDAIAQGEDLAWTLVDGGRVCKSYGWRAYTTGAFIAKVDGRVHIQIGLVPPIDPRPVKIHETLTWITDPRMKPEKVEAKLRAWIASSDQVMRLSGGQMCSLISA